MPDPMTTADILRAARAKQRCGTCKWLAVPADKAGRRIPRTGHVYRCVFPIIMPALPDSVTRDHGFRALAPVMHMEPSNGTTCPTWTEKETP